jgi:hypothetical protein
MRDLPVFMRFARDVPEFLRRPLSVDDAGAAMRARLRGRDAAFTAFVQRVGSRRPRGPHALLLRSAGCEVGDIRRLVDAEGLEGALTTLAERGVYFAYDEFKCRRPTVRGSDTFHFRESEFDNPLFAPRVVAYSSGSGGRPSRILRSLAMVEEISGGLALALHAHFAAGDSSAFWRLAPTNEFLMHAKIGRRIEGWLHPVEDVPIEVRVGTPLLRTVFRLGGRSVPAPRFVDLADPTTMARWVSERRPIVVSAVASAVARIAFAARDNGIDLSGVTFLAQSEPLTEARRRAIHSAGARLVANYAAMETNSLAYSCADPARPESFHASTDRFAFISRERAVDGGGTVPVLAVTSLSPHASKVMINTELGDAATVRRLTCDCALGRQGLDTHLSDIFSFEKLTGEGVSFALSGLRAILEERLPARFGGTGLDYQLAERVGVGPSTRLTLRINPRVGPIDADAIHRTFLEWMADGNAVDRHHAELLRAAGSLEVVSEEPIATGAGKVLPFRRE